MTRDSEAALLAITAELIDDQTRRLQLRAAFPDISLDTAEAIIAACRHERLGWRAFRLAVSLLAARG